LHHCHLYKIFSNLTLFIWNILCSFCVTKTRKNTSVTIKFHLLLLVFWTIFVLLFKGFYFMYFIFSTKIRKMTGYEVLYHSYKLFSNLTLFIWNILCSFYVNKTRKNTSVIVKFHLLLYVFWIDIVLLFKSFYLMYFMFFT